MKYHWTGICFFVLALCVWRLDAQDSPKGGQEPATTAESDDRNNTESDNTDSDSSNSDSSNSDTPRGEDTEKKSGLLMRQKLKYSQRMLEGLATEDFEMIRKNARLMNAFNQLESRFWADTPEYRSQLQTFQFTNNKMMRMAEAKNLEGVALAYTQMTMTCFNCHVLVRESGDGEKSRK
jgi:hypothetical protein